MTKKSEIDMVKEQINIKIQILEKNLQETRWSDHYRQGDDLFLQGQINGYRNALILVNNLH